MRKQKGLAALTACLLVAAGGWMLNRSKTSGSASTAVGSRGWNTTHERVFLTEQLRRNPTHAPILLRLAQIERSEGNLDGAREHLEQALAVDSGLIDVRLELGLVCAQMGDFMSAEEQNRAVLRMDPTQPDALYNLGAIFANRGDPQQARKFWNDAVRTGRNTEAAAKARQAIELVEAVR